MQRTNAPNRRTKRMKWEVPRLLINSDERRIEGIIRTLLANDLAIIVTTVVVVTTVVIATTVVVVIIIIITKRGIQIKEKAAIGCIVL